MTAHIITFPGRRPSSTNAITPHESGRPALRDDGVPLRTGDAVAITGPRGFAVLHRGIITGATHNPGDINLTYAVQCTDGIHRSVRADRVRAEHFINRHTGEQQA